MTEPSTQYPAWILERSFGGLGTAVSPVANTRHSNWPEGRVAPMAKEACAQLVKACNSDERASLPCFVFLVGGAGNGKSKIAGDTVQLIDGVRLGEPGRFAQRIFDYRLGSGRHLKVVNDATIPSATDNGKPALGSDIAAAIGNSSHLLACVNRGVLIGEATSPEVGSTPNEVAAALITHWLLDMSPERETDIVAETRLETFSDTSCSHYAFAKLFIDGEATAIIHVVFMDQASLLETWPTVGDSPGEHLSHDALAPSDIAQVPVLSRDHSGGPTAEFAQPLQQLAQTMLGGEPWSETDPIKANGWCAVLRGAEVISGSHFTYRELWALGSHSLVGPCTAADLEKLHTWIASKRAVAAASDKEAALRALVSLSSLRSHMMLFDAGRGSVSGCPADTYSWPATTNEALKAVCHADPLREFGPGDGKEYTMLVDLLAGIEDGRSRPGRSLAEADPLIEAYWTGFDTEFENAIAGLVDPENSKATLKHRNEILAWYGRYMFRLVGMARGWPAHVSLISKWQESWTEARSKQLLPLEIEKALMQIILPSRIDSNDTFFPALRSRVDMTPSGGTALEIEVERGDFKIDIRTSGYSIIATLKDRTRSEGTRVETLLDFHLLREALAKDDGRGFTDSLSVIEPRVERVRAGLLAAQAGKKGEAQRYQARLSGRPIEFRMKG